VYSKQYAIADRRDFRQYDMFLKVGSNTVLRFRSKSWFSAKPGKV